MNLSKINEYDRELISLSTQCISSFKETDTGNYKFFWNIETAEGFVKLMFNLLLQEQYKAVKDGNIIPLEVMLNMLKQNINSENNFPKKRYDYSEFNIKPKELDTIPNLLRANRVKKLADKIKTFMEVMINTGEIERYLLFVNIDNQSFYLADNEDRYLELVFDFFVQGCKKFSLNPIRLIRLFRETAHELRTQSLGQSTDGSLVFYKIGTGGRYDFNRSIEELTKTQKIESIVLKKLTYQYDWTTFSINTESTSFILTSTSDDAATLDWLTDCTKHLIDNADDLTWRTSYLLTKNFITSICPK